MGRAGIIAVFVAAALVACDGGADDPRRVPPGDAEFVDLETPEQTGECAEAAACEATCLHACALVNNGPVTCPTDPPPLPDRLQAATCSCFETVCAWLD